MTHDMNLFMKPRYMRWHQLLRCILLLLMMMAGGSTALGATINFNHPNGYYYLGNDAGNNGVPKYDPDIFEANFYMCPTYSTTVNANNYLNGDVDKPLITTFKSFPSNGKTYSYAVWYIEAVEGEAGFFYIKHRDTGKYLVANDNTSPAANRRRVNLGPTSNPGDDGKFRIQSDDNGVTYYISSKTKQNGNNKYVNPSKGNLDYLFATSDNSNTGGILGFWSEKTTNSAWHIEPVRYEEPVISFDNTTYEVTMEAASPDATIYYTTNGSNPDKDNVGGANPTQLYNPASKPVLSEPTTIKAIAIAAGYAASAVANLTVSRAATPSFTFSEGKVIINCATGGASIYYEIANTAEGVSEPTTLSTRYSTPIIGAAGKYIKAFAVKNGCFNSTAAVSEKIVFPCSKPVIRKASETTFTIECRFPTSGVTIYYTTNGETPTTSSNRYEGAVTFNTSDLPFTVKAIAVASDYTDSEIAISEITEGLATDDEGYLVIVSDYDYSRFLTMVGSDGSGSKFKITEDINASGTGIVLTSFTGELVGVAKADGTYPVISNLDHPLFASTSNAVIKNVILKDVSISGSGNVGAIVCEAKGYTRIYNCGILPNSADFPDAIGSHPSVSGTGYVGSLVGRLEDDSRVVNCFSYADVNGGSVAGGIVGYNNFASDASETDGKYTKLRTMVVNCMYYGNVSGTKVYPVYGGQKISNKGDNAINNYNFYSVGCTFSGTSTPTDYNCSWPAKLEYLTRYEFHRSLLNSNRELCGWWVGAPSAPSTMSTTDVQAVPKDASLMAKWVLDPTIAPYPILKPFGIYASPINQDPDKRLDGSDRAISSNWGQSKAPDTEGQILGSILVSISGGAHHSGSSSRMINITAMDTLFHDNCYGKIQLPYYNDIFGDPEGSTWTDKYGGNYGDYVVTGWDITTVTGGTAGSLTENWETGYNFTDRKCTAKDLKRTFAQGGYYYVPEGVTGITITAHWAQAIYFDNTDHSYDRVYMSGTTLDTANPGVHFAPAGTRPSTLANNKPVYSEKISDVANYVTSNGTVYDWALVLVGNHQYRTSRNNIAGTHNSWGFTIMSADFDLDNEPDYSLIWQLGQVYDRQSFCPIRFDFLPVVEMGLAMKEDGSTQYYSLGCYRPLGHFEVTETSLIRFGQFEFSNLNRSIYAPIILNGGIYDQYCKGTNNNAFKTADDKIDYIILGGNVRMPSFTPGAHVNSNANFPTRHCAVNVLGGSIDKLYLTGNYNDGVTPNTDNPHCYIDGGNFQQVAAAGKEGIYGNVFWKINHSLIKEFYGGGTMDLSTGNNYKTVKGNIDVTIDNSKVTKYCGGPKFGNMENDKTVTTRATGTTFTYYYGGGNGGTSYVQYDKTDVTTTATNYNWNGTGTNQGHVNNYTPGSYRDRTTGYQANYDMEIINSSAGTEIGKAVMRTYFFAAQFSATNTGSITNSLTDCEVLTNFYGGGNLGGVNGDVTSTLTDTHVHGSAFGGGYSASVPEVNIYDKNKTAPTLNLNTAIITPQSGGTSTTYTWTNDPSLSTTNPISGDGKYFYTEVPLTNLGSVTGNVTLNIEGSSVVEGNEYTINTTDFSYSLKTANVGGVFGGGDESAVSGADKQVLVNINTTSTGSTQYINNVFGGGNNGDVASEVTVNVIGTSNIKNDVFGGGKGQTTVVGGDVTVNIGAKSADVPPVYTGKASIGGDVYGGSALGNTNATKGTGWTKEDLKLSAVAGKSTLVNVYGGSVTGSIYGGGLGELSSGTAGQEGYVAPIASNVYGPVTVTVEGSATGENVTAVTAANVFGCNNLYGTPQSTVEVFIKGTAAASGETPNPIGNVYGGGNLAAAGTVESPLTPDVQMTGGAVNNIYGGGLGASAVLTGNTSVTFSGGTINNNIYGGGDAADVTGNVSVSVTGGTVTHDVYGGGALADTNTASTTTTVGETTTTTYPNTTISLTGGTIDNVYGGGLGRKEVTGENPVSAIAAKSGNVLVELNKGVSTEAKGCVVNQIFGGNNLNGYPLGTATVHVFKTQHAGKAKISEKVSDSADAGYYDVQAVYGGGNEADYIPADTRQSTEVIIEDCDNTLIKDVYGGGNAAAVPATEVWILGAKKIDNVFGGGNGELGADHAAHVGFHRLTESTKSDYEKGTGKTEVKLVGGNINVVYGGSNSNGDIRGGAFITMPQLSEYNSTHDPDATTCDLITQHIYGGGKNADMSSGTNIVLGCMPDAWIGEIYAGAQAADVAGDVNLTITSGKFERVFGGNKDSGKLEGSITVNIEETGECDVPIVIGELYGGGNLANYSIYGYNNDGTIKDKATFDAENEGKSEAEKATPYADPQVNVRAFTSIGAIYGGGYSAKVIGNPSVDVNVAIGSHADNNAIHTGGEGNIFPAGTTGGDLKLPYPAHTKGEIGAIGNVFGGGNLADVIGNTSINIGTQTEIAFVSTPAHLTANAETGKYPVSGANITGSVYGGGNAADIDGNTTVTIGTVNLTGEGKNGTKIAGDVFGGGLGATTTVTGDVEVNIGADTGETPAHNYVGYAVISGDVYGGSAKGKVNATKGGTVESPTYAASTGTTQVNFYGGTITGDLYGGGYGLDNAQADVYGAVNVNVFGGTVPNVYGGNNLSGATQDAVNVNIVGGTISQHVYGGGNAADALGDVTVTVTGGTMTDVYGGGKGQTTVVGGDVIVNIGTKTVSEGKATYNGTGTITGDVYGGSALGAVNATKDPSTGVLSATSDKTTAVNIYAATSLAGNVFGGGLGDVASLGEGHSDIVAQNFGNTTVTMEGATVSGAVYGGANTNGTLHGDATVTITGGTIHTAPGEGDPIADVVFGGGYGQPTRVDGDVEVNIGTNTAGTLAGNAIIHGNVYGGSAEGKVNGTTAESNTHTTQVNLNKGTVNGALFGGGLGEVGIPANVYGAVTVTTKGGTAQDVFGCNNVNGAPQQAVAVIIDGGTVGNVYGGGKDAAYSGTPSVTVSGGVVTNNVFGGGLGATAIVNGGTSVTISGGTVNHDVFGGGSLANVTQSVSVSVTGGKVINDVYGGGALAHTNTDNWNGSTFVPVSVSTGVTLVTGLYTAESDGALITAPDTKAADATTYYQKGNWKDGFIIAGKTKYNTTVSLTGGVVGNAYGGGLGQLAVNVVDAERKYNQTECNEYNATLDGYIASGTELTADQATAVNTALGTTYSASDAISEPHANAYNAKLNGAITTSDTKPAEANILAVGGIAANVYGDVTVTVNGTAFTHSFESPKDANKVSFPNTLDVPITGRVFGCNNLNGTPMGNVLVEVERTLRITDDGEISSEHQENIFEIHSVYGGGNLATYQPAVGKGPEVIIKGCSDTSIEKVFGGGNSASVPSTNVSILGTFYVGYAFSGGNGADMFKQGDTWYVNNGAAIYGNARIEAIGGKIGQVFGGSDTKGTVYGTTTTRLNGEGDFSVVTDCPLQITNAYGAARGADIEGDVNFIVAGCKADQIERVFGGSYDANIRGSITLTITGGIFSHVFGGNDHGGTIGGEINVNIEETEPNCRPIVIQYLYGGGREAEYPGRGAKYITNSIDPSTGKYIGSLTFAAFPNTEAKKNAKITVNVKSATRIDNIYGGCYRAKVNGDTEVNINMMKGNWVNKEITFPDTYRGDQIPNVDSPAGTYVEVEDLDPSASVTGLYTKDPVTEKFTRIDDLHAVANDGTYYRLTFMTGTVKDEIGTIGNVFGGCFEGVVNGNTKVNIGTETTVPILKRNGEGKIVDAYGAVIYDFEGKLLPGKTMVYVDNPVLGAHITGDVYAGGHLADVTGNTVVNICAKDNGSGYDAVAEGASKVTIAGNVFGGGKGASDTFTCEKAMVGKDGDNDGSGSAGRGTSVHIGNGTIAGTVYGGGEIGRVEFDTEVTIGFGAGGTNTSKPVIEGNVYGAGMGVATHGYSGLVRGNSFVTIEGDAKVRESVYGGGAWASLGRYWVALTPEEARTHGVEVGMPYDLKSGGKATVVVQGKAEIGPADGMQMTASGKPDDTGHVYGAGRGILPYEGAGPYGRYYLNNNVLTFEAYGESNESDYISYTQTLGITDNTDVTISGDAFVKGSVYGGSENGHVRTNTLVKIQGGQIGCGEGKSAPYTTSDWTGEDPANFTECAHWPYESPYAPYDKYADADGKYEDGSSAAGGYSSGTDGHTFYGNVFGGGSGYYPYKPGRWLKEAGSVGGNTEVIISGGHILTNVYGGNEMTDVDGSCTITMSGGSVGVPRTLAQIAAHPVTCYVFGGGKGDQRVLFNQDTNVDNVNVTITGGRIFGSVFGGGEDGHVLGNVTMTIGDASDHSGPTVGTWGTSYVDGNIFGGGRGFGGEALTAGVVCGNVDLSIHGGTMLGSVYGGGRLASVGTRLVGADQADYGELIPDGKRQIVNHDGTATMVDASGVTHGYITVNITGGKIGNEYEYRYLTSSVDISGMTADEIAEARTTELQETYHLPLTNAEYSSDRGYYLLNHPKGGNVFAGCMGRREGLHDDTPMINWRKLGSAKSTKVTVEGNTWIKGSVYGGGEYGAVMGTHATKNNNNEDINVGTEVLIKGGVIGTVMGSDINNGTYSTGLGSGDTRYSFGSVWGGGYGTEAEANLTTTDVETFGAWVEHDTYVKMTGGSVRASVFGGGKLACVKGDTYVDISGGEVGVNALRANNYVLFGSWRMGNVFGAGKGSENAILSGLVAGNTHVNISGGSIYHNVYGGGALGSVGTFTLADAAYHSANPRVPEGAPLTWSSGGDATVTITGGQIGINGWDNGMVNGSSRGDINTNKPTDLSPTDPYDNLAWVNNTVVTIGKESDGTLNGGSGGVYASPLIKGTVYGGGENGHNQGNAVVNVHSGTIGFDETSALTHERGNVFGAGCGTDTYSESTADVKYFNPMGGRVRGTTQVNIDGGHVLHSVYGGGSMGSADGQATVTISGGRIGTSSNDYGCVYGGPKGNLQSGDWQAYTGASVVNINYATTPAGDDGTTQLIKNNVFGGGEAGNVYGSVVVNMTGGLVMNNLYGGGALADTNTDNWDPAANSGVGGWASGKTSASNTTAVHLKGGTIMGDAYGGGLGRFAKAAVGTPRDPGYEPAETEIDPKVYGNIEVNLNEAVANDAKGCIVTGIFGCNDLRGTPKGHVLVNVFKTQNALKDKIEQKFSKYAAFTETDYADLKTSLQTVRDELLTYIPSIPDITLTADWTTLNSSSDAKVRLAAIENIKAMLAAKYDVQYVYGGGDLAPYEPQETEENTEVNIYGCDETSIRTVYGGGNAASTPANTIIVYSTYEIEEVFGGGNGKDNYQINGKWYQNPGADVGYRGLTYHELTATEYEGKTYDGSEEAKPYRAVLNTGAGTKEGRQTVANGFMYGTGVARTSILGGRIHNVYGGSNEKGNIRQEARSRYEETTDCPMQLDYSYGAGKNADIDGQVIVIMDCVQNIDNIFGGSTNADVYNDIILNITNGTFKNVFGGNDTNGAIYGSITVNVEEKGCQPIFIGELYGGGYLAPYSIYGYKRTADGSYERDANGKIIPLKAGDEGALATPHKDPRINVISASRIGTIYGGGYQAAVVGSPSINVNMQEGMVLKKYVNDTDYSEGEHTDAKGNKYKVVRIVADEGPSKGNAVLAIGPIGNIYGGGNEADIIGNTFIEIGTGQWVTSWDSDRNPVYEDIDRKAAFITGSVYGGGKMGHVGDFSPVGSKPTSCAEGTGTCTVTISNGNIGPDDMKMYVTDGSGTIDKSREPDDAGHVFGGGQGTVDILYDQDMTDEEKQTAIAALSESEIKTKEAALDKQAYVNKTEVTINGTAFVKGSVYGGSENGHVLGDTHVTIDGDCQIGNGDGVNRPYTADEWAYDVTADQTKYLAECASWPYGIDSDKDGKKETFQPHDMYANAGGDYEPEGAVIASDGHTFYGNVFGGGSGYYPYAPGRWSKKAGWVEGNTLVEIKGGHILTNVYGGNEMTDVGDGLTDGKGKTTVRMSGGTLGVPRTLEQIDAHPVTCYLFGAGKGDQNVHFNKNTNVKEVEVELTGGTIYGSIFGGGEDGHVLGNVKMTIGNADGTGPTIGTWGTSYVDGNIFGGGRGFSGEAFTAGNVGGSIDLQIKGGLMLGSIYGGGRLASVGYGLYDIDNPNYGKMCDDDKDDDGNDASGYYTNGRGHVSIDISGGTIGNDHEYKYYAVDVNTKDKTWTEIETERSAWLTTQKAADYLPNTEFLLHDSIAADNENKTKTYVYRLFHSKGGNVYCGGMGRYTNLSGNNLPRWFNLGSVKSTKLTIRDNARIKSSVYGGCELGQVAGSYRDASLFEKEITIEDGKEVVAAEKEIPTRTSETLTDILITGGEIGSDIKDADGVTRLVFGAVYGGGYGDTREKLTYEVGGQKYESNPKFSSGVIEGNTRMEMRDGTVHSSIYGGGKVGNVHGNASVTISGGTVGKDMLIRTVGEKKDTIRYGGQYMGNVYGGGAGNRNIVRCGQIFGNTNVNVSQAEGKTTRIYHNIYGGGAFGTVGRFEYDTRTDEAFHTTKVYGVESLKSDGTATVTITGGTIGYDGKNNGMVFGSSRGDVSDPHYRDNFMAFVGNSIINIGTTGQGFDAPQPQIKGSVYGSGENGHVMEKTTVNIHSGTIGIPSGTPVDGLSGVSYPYRGNVYGGGCGTDTYIENGQEMYNPMAGIVLGNTEVNIDGGHVVRNVYGGGSMGSVGFITDSIKHASIADGFGLSWPYEFTYKGGTGTAAINITGGRIGMGDSGIVGVDNGNVYGGARGTAGERFYAAHLANIRQTKVTIDYPGDTPTTDNGSTTPLIAGSVFGGGEDGHIYENTQVFLRNGRIGHSLFGGGRGEGTYLGRLVKIPSSSGETDLMQIRDISTGKVYGNTYVEMSGGHVVHNILGGGYMASVGKGNYASGADDYFPTGYGETLVGNLWTSPYAPDPEKAADDPVNVKDNAWHFLNSGKTRVHVKGGIIGSTDIWDGLPSGSVFGGSRGLAAPNIAMPTVEQCPVFYNGYVNETHIHIYDSTGVAAPRIYGSVYGGGQDGHVRRDAHVIIDAGEIGLPYTSENQTTLGTSELDDPQWLHRGNVYGAGSGIGQYAFDFNYNGNTDDEGETGYSSSAGSVMRFTQVDVNGGTIHRNVYGGGSMGSVGAPNLGQEDDPYKKGDTADGHGPGKQSFCTVNIAGTIGTPVGYNPIYGGEVYGASRGLSTLDPAQFSTTVWTKVNIFKTATVKGNVFGGGDAGAVRKDAEVVVGEE